VEAGPMDMSEKKAGVSRIKRYGIPLLVILLGIVLSITAFVVLRERDRQRIRTQFELEADDHYETLKKEINFNLHVLLSVQALY
jgi:CHASE1-domain containing sensor protein